MKYRNTRTGAVIETASVCSGAEWVEVAESKPARKTAASTPKKNVKKGVKSVE